MEQLSGSNLVLLLILILWVLPWKGYSLWLAARNSHKTWFILLIILNTFGILEIIYVFGIAKKTWSDIRKAVFRLLSYRKRTPKNTSN
jgi:hypothetical protein